MGGRFDYRNRGLSDFQERRRKADWMVRMATILSLVAWVVALVVWVVLEMASPEKEVEWFTSIGRIRGTEILIRDYWDVTLLPIAFWLLVASVVICVVAFIFNALRMRRKTDKYRKSIFVMAGLAVLGIVVFLLRFGFPF